MWTRWHLKITKTITKLYALETWKLSHELRIIEFIKRVGGKIRCEAVQNILLVLFPNDFQVRDKFRCKALPSILLFWICLVFANG